MCQAECEYCFRDFCANFWEILGDIFIAFLGFCKPFIKYASWKCVLALWGIDCWLHAELFGPSSNGIVEPSQIQPDHHDLNQYEVDKTLDMGDIIHNFREENPDLGEEPYMPGEEGHDIGREPYVPGEESHDFGEEHYISGQGSRDLGDEHYFPGEEDSEFSGEEYFSEEEVYELREEYHPREEVHTNGSQPSRQSSGKSLCHVETLIESSRFGGHSLVDQEPRIVVLSAFHWLWTL